VALPAFVPPNERRGLVLIDPPYEQKDEFERIAAGFAEAFAKWPTGSYLLWYPVKSRRVTDNLARHVAGVAETSKPAGKCLRLEFSVAPQEARVIFVREALVEGHSKLRADFLQHNANLRASITTMEAKIRRRDILLDEQAQCEFYLARLPEHINSIAALEKWLRERSRGADGKAGRNEGAATPQREVQSLFGFTLSIIENEKSHPAIDRPASVDRRGDSGIAIC